MRRIAFALALLLAAPAMAQTQAVTATAGPSLGITTNRITTGGTFQIIATFADTRHFFSFQNICNKAGNCTSTANLCYLFMADTGTPTLSNALIVSPGQEYLRSVGAIPHAIIQATCDGTSDNFHFDLSQ